MCAGKDAKTQPAKEQAEKEAKEKAEKAKANKKPNQDLLEKLATIKKNADAIKEHERLSQETTKLYHKQSSASKADMKIIRKSLVDLKNEKKKLNNEFNFSTDFEAYKMFKVGGLESIHKLYSEVCSKGNGFISSKLSVCKVKVDKIADELKNCAANKKSALTVCPTLQDKDLPTCEKEFAGDYYKYGKMIVFGPTCHDKKESATKECYSPYKDLFEILANSAKIQPCLDETGQLYKDCSIKACTTLKPECSNRAELTEQNCKKEALDKAYISAVYTTDCKLPKLQTELLIPKQEELTHPDDITINGGYKFKTTYERVLEDVLDAQGNPKYVKTPENIAAQSACMKEAWVDIAEIDALIGTLRATTTDYDSF